MKQSSSPKSRVALLVIISAAFGALLGVLFAPESGKVNRSRLKDYFRNLGKGL